MEWISIKNELPPKYDWVLVKALKIKEVDGPSVFVAQMGKYGEDNAWDAAYGDGYIPPEIEIRYWKRLPE